MIDSNGQYIILHAVIECVGVVLVGLYVPPPATVNLLYTVYAYSTDNLIILGDLI